MAVALLRTLCTPAPWCICLMFDYLTLVTLRWASPMFVDPGVSIVLVVVVGLRCLGNGPQLIRRPGPLRSAKSWPYSQSKCRTSTAITENSQIIAVTRNAPAKRTARPNPYWLETGQRAAAGKVHLEGLDRSDNGIGAFLITCTLTRYRWTVGIPA
jgi:hypothetical protein